MITKYEKRLSNKKSDEFFKDKVWVHRYVERDEYPDDWEFNIPFKIYTLYDGEKFYIVEKYIVPDRRCECDVNFAHFLLEVVDIDWEFETEFTELKELYKTKFRKERLEKIN
jgi:hypothetical protein